MRRSGNGANVTLFIDNDVNHGVNCANSPSNEEIKKREAAGLSVYFVSFLNSRLILCSGSVNELAT